MSTGGLGSLRRVAVTAPPRAWNAGLDLNAAEMIWGVLQGIGLEIFPIDIELLATAAPDARADHLRALRDFAPQAAISTPNVGYAIRTLVPEGQNVLFDLLDVPVLVTWDSVVQFPDQLLGPLPDRPDESRGEVIARLRAWMSDPRIMHVAYDSGQIEVFDRLGILPAGRTTLECAFCQQPYIDFGLAGHDVPQTEELVFAGTLRAERLASALSTGLDWYGGLQEAVVFGRRLAEPVWSALERWIDEAGAEPRAARRLDPDQTFFWRVAYDCMSAASAWDRWRIVAAMPRTVSVYGEQGDRLPANARGCGRVDMITELPRLNAATAITLDGVNRISHKGITAKVLGCFAAGGFSLFDWRPDFLQFAGPDAEYVMFRDEGEAAAKLEYFLARPAQRRELSAHLRAFVARETSADSFYRRMLARLAAQHGLA